MGMLKVKDIPINILNDLKNVSLNTKYLYSRYPEFKDIVKQIETDYSLNLNDLKKSIQHNIELDKHTCEYCGKPVHYSKRIKGFPRYCCISCMSRDPRTKEKARKTNLEKYGVTTPLANSAWMKEACLNKYGVTTASQLAEIKDKIKITNQIKYGGNAPVCSKEIKDKIAKTNLNKYGGNAPICDNKIKQKIIKTNLEKYGYAVPTQNPAIFNKVKQTNLERYGIDTFLKTEKLDEARKTYNYNYLIDRCNKEKIVYPLFSKEEFFSGKKIFKWKCAFCGEEFEAEYKGHRLPICRHCFTSRRSGQQSKFTAFIYDYLKTFIDINNKKLIKPYELDIYIPSINIAFEFNGDYWHSLEQNPDKNYHLNKTKLCEEKGIKLIHVSEYNWTYKQEYIKKLIKNILDKKINFKEKQIKLDRSIFNKCFLKELGYHLIKELPPKLIYCKTRNFKYYNCGYLIAEKD